MSPIELELQRQLKQFWLKDIEATFDLAFTAMQAGFNDAAGAIKSQYAANDAVKTDGYNKTTLCVGIGGAVLALAAAVLAIPSGGTSVAAYFGVSAVTVAGLGVVGSGVALTATAMPGMAPSARATVEVDLLLASLTARLTALKAKLFSATGSSALIESVFKAARNDPQFALATKQSDTEKLRRKAIVALFFPRFLDKGDLADAVRTFAAESFANLLREYSNHLTVQNELASRAIQSVPESTVYVERQAPVVMRDQKQIDAIRARLISPAALSASFLRSAQLARWLSRYNVVSARGWGLGS